MAAINQFLQPNDLSKVANLRVFARQVVEGFCTGLHVSPHKGFSVEFREHRAYVPGDEIRHLDWKVFAKTDRFYILEYEEETNLRANIALDASGSMNYGEGDANKFLYAQRLAAVLSYMMVQQQDAVGLMTFDTDIRTYIPPRSRPSHLQVLTEALTACEPGNETGLGTVLSALAQKIRRRGLFILLSDCFGDVNDIMSSLAHLRYKHQEILVFQIWHRDELEFPFKKWTRFECLEQDGLHRNLDPVQLRHAYMSNLKTFREDLKKGCSSRRIDLIPLVTDQPYAEALAQYFSLRRRTK